MHIHSGVGSRTNFARTRIPWYQNNSRRETTLRRQAYILTQEYDEVPWDKPHNIPQADTVMHAPGKHCVPEKSTTASHPESLLLSPELLLVREVQAHALHGGIVLMHTRLRTQTRIPAGCALD